MTAQSATRDAIAEEQNSLVGEWSFDRVSRGIDSVGGGLLELAPLKVPTNCALPLQHIVPVWEQQRWNRLHWSEVNAFRPLSKSPLQDLDFHKVQLKCIRPHQPSHKQ